MENLLKSMSLTRRAFWLVELRWVAIAALVAATLFASIWMEITLPTQRLYTIAALVAAYNGLLHVLLRCLTYRSRTHDTAEAGGIITFQIAMDLLILSTILHYSGGIENPFFLFFVFHMIIAGILRSRLQSYLLATVAVLMFGGIVLLEAYGRIEHHPLTGFVDHAHYKNKAFVLGMLFVYSATLYLLVYMTTSIAAQLRSQQEDLEEANAKLQKKDKIKNEYVLRVTHDIKGHLAAIKSCLNLVYEQTVGPLNEKQVDLSGRAYKRTSKCLAFVLALLKVTRMKLSGQLDISDFSLPVCLASALDHVRRRAEDKAIKVSSDIDETIGTLHGEAILIEETIMNILANAVKYTPEGGQVHMTVRQEDGSVHIAIQDTGIGIAEKEQERIFEEFYRTENARTTERDGTGLGLSFAKQVIERHAGRIWVESNSGKGSTFFLTLPMPTPEKDAN
jgi:signal transduction histidine kinase